MPQVLSDANLQRTLNEELDPVLRQELALRVVAMRIFKVKTVPISGKYLRIVAKYGGNFYGAGRPEPDGTHKLPGMNASSLYQDRRAKLRTLEMKHYRRAYYTTVDMSGWVRAAPQTESGGFSNVGKLIMDDTVENLKEMVSHRLASGQHGVYGKVASVSSNVVTLVAADVNIPWGGNRFMREGMVHDFTSGSYFTALRTSLDKERGRMLDSVSEDTSTPTITYNDLGTAAVDNAIAANDHIVMFDSRDTSAIASGEYDTKCYQPQGIMDAVNNASDAQYAIATYGGLDPTAYTPLQSIRVHNSGTLRVVQLDDFNLAYEKVEIDQYAGDRPNLIYTTPSVRRKVAAFLTPTSGNLGTTTNVRYNDIGRSNVNVGIPGIEITTLGATGSMPLYADPLAPHHRIYLCNTKTLMMVQDEAPGFIDDDGQTLRINEGEDAFWAGWKMYTTGLICWHRRKNAYIVDATGDPLS